MRTLIERIAPMPLFEGEGGGAGGGDGGGDGGGSGTGQQVTGQQVTGQQVTGQQVTGQTPSFIDSITDPDARGLVEKKGYKDANDVAVAYRHMVQLHGKAPNVIALPEGDDDQDGWNSLYSRLGRPDSPENYSYKPPEGAPQTNAQFLETMRAKAHEAGLTQKQFETLASANDEFLKQAIENQQAESTKTAAEQEAALVKAFGGEQRFEQAKLTGQRAVKALGLPDQVLDALDANLGVPAVMQLMSTIGSKIAGEDSFIEGVSQDGFGMSPTQAKGELDRLKGDAEFQKSIITPTHANHRANLAKWQELQRVAFSRSRR